MRGFRDLRRTARGPGSLISLILACGLLSASAAGAQGPRMPTAESPPLQRLPLPTPDGESARAKAFCPLGGCRPAQASPWSTAAFGLAVAGIGWTARSRETAES